MPPPSLDPGGHDAALTVLEASALPGPSGGPTGVAPDVGVDEELELYAGFGGEQDGLGGEAVAEAVAGRLGSAFRGGGAAGLGAVGAGGFRFEVG